MEKRKKYTLSELYELSDKDIIELGNKINFFCTGDNFILVKHVSTGLNLLSNNESIYVFGIKKGENISQKLKVYNIDIEIDSLVIYKINFEELYILSVEDDYDIQFVTATTKIIEYNPRGEEIHIEEETPDKQYSLAEQWFLEQLTDLEEVRLSKYPDSIFYKKNGEVLFEYDKETKYFWVSEEKIWSFFESNFGLNYQEIKELIKGMVEEHLNLGEVTPMLFPPVRTSWVEEHLNLGEVTPKGFPFFNYMKVEEHLNLGEVTPVRSAWKTMFWRRNI